MILDSNLVIYSARAEYPGLRRWIATSPFAVSAISLVEVLGYRGITEALRRHYESVFAAAQILPITNAVLDRAVALRQARKMSLGDAVIAATALIARRTLYTHNRVDFVNIAGLAVVDPIAAGDAP